jgi:dienelactone hydrolase
MKKNILSTVVAVTCCGFMQNTVAGTIDFIGTSGSDWADATSWSSGALPGEITTDTVRIINEEVRITTALAPINSVSISTGVNTVGGTLAINNHVSNIDLLRVGASQANSNGTVNHTIGGVRANDVMIGLAGGTGIATYTMLGGWLILEDDFFLRNTGTFNLVNDYSHIKVGGDAFIDTGATLNLILGDDGINTIDVTDKLTIGTGAKLTIDGTLFSQNNVSIKLIEASTISGSFAAEDITLTGFDSFNAIVVKEGNIVRLNIGEVDTSTYAAELTALAALGDLTTAPILRDENGTVITLNAGDVRAVYYDALDYQGIATRVFARVGIPATATTSNPVPGIVLVHGGGGTAYDEWVTKWNDRGYAAIAIAVEGQTDESDTVNGGYVEHQWAGPARDGIYNDTNIELTDQWMYHATADTILANSLIRSLPIVDSGKVGISGISWGGVITSTTIGIDNRFAFAIPIYGCGDMENANNWWGNALIGDPIYEEVFDPMVRIEKASIPSLWVSWPQENNFPLGQQATTYRGVTGDRMVTLIPDLGHGHIRGWNVADSYDFADSVLTTGSPWAKQLYVGVTGSEAKVKFYSTKVLSSASLISTADIGVTGDRIWTEETATLTNLGSNIWQVTATLPTGVTGWYVNTVSGDLVMSSGYQGDEGGTDISPYSNIDSTGWVNTDEATVSIGGTVAFAPHPNDTGTWSWTGPNDFTGIGRSQTISGIQATQSGEYIATYTDIDGNNSKHVFTITVQ